MSSEKVFEAMKTGQWETVKEIIATASWTSAELDKRHGVLWDSLLTKAAREGKEDVVLLLLDAGTAIEVEGTFTALFCAAQCGHLKIVEILLNRGANIEAGNGYWSTPLMVAAKNGHSEVAALLIERGANIHAQNKGDGSTALHWAAQSGLLKVAETLLDLGADTEPRNTHGCTPLMEASVYGHFQLVTLLVDRGADINTRENGGRSALRRSAESRQVAVVKLLCSKGADIDAQEVKEYMHDLSGGYLPTRYSAKNQIIAAIQAEVEWRRVKNFVVFLHAGGLSAADWSVRRIGGGGSMPTTTAAATAAVVVPDIPSTGVILRGRQSKVLENRDLCRIVASYSIPK